MITEDRALDLCLVLKFGNEGREACPLHEILSVGGAKKATENPIAIGRRCGLQKEKNAEQQFLSCQSSIIMSSQVSMYILNATLYFRAVSSSQLPTPLAYNV